MCAWEIAIVSLQMLLNLHKKTWMTGLQLTDFKEHSASNEKIVKVCSIVLIRMVRFMSSSE